MQSPYRHLPRQLRRRSERVTRHNSKAGAAVRGDTLKLEQHGWIQAEWKPTENNRRAKFYSLTRLGRRHLEREAANWERISTAISNVMRLTEV